MKSIKTTITLFIILAGFTMLTVNQSVQTWLNWRSNANMTSHISTVLNRDYDRSVQQQIFNAISLLKAVEEYRVTQGMSQNEGRELARNLLRGVNYGDGTYFWIDTYDGTTVLMPVKPAIEGKNRYNEQDVKGSYLIQNIISRAREGGGYTEYWYPRPGETEAKPKRSYSAAFEPYGWVIGTGNYVDDIQNEVMAQKEELDTRLRNSIVVSLLLFTLLLSLGAVAAFLIGRSIARPVISIADAADKIASGALGLEIESSLSSRKDEIGTMSRAIKNLTYKLREVISDINAVSLNLSTSSEESSSSAVSFSESSQSQAASVEEINATIEQVSASIESVSDNIVSQIDSVQSLSDQVHALKDIEQTLRALVGQIAGLSGDINNRASAGHEALERMNQQFADISGSSESMRTIVNLITDIADQINLLSLNASIEARGAGEHGRGFAVVAEEISRLADQTATNVRIIQDNINSSESSIKEGAVAVVDLIEKWLLCSMASIA
jgi:methyl-accepting chemotaxis protein